MGKDPYFERLLAQIRDEFNHLRWNFDPVHVHLVHRATNAEAEGVVGIPQARHSVVAFEGAGHRDMAQRFDEQGHPKFRDDPIVDVRGKPIVNSAGEAFDVVMPAFRTLSFGGDGAAATQLRAIAERAGRVLAQLRRFPAMELLVGWRFSSPRELWWSLVFELAWARRNPLLAADRRLWLPADNPTSFLPYDLRQIKALATAKWPQMQIPSEWLERLPEAWESEIDNMALASVDALDYLLSEIAPNETRSDEGQMSFQFPANAGDHPGEQIRRRFAIAVSFPGEHRTTVQAVANALEPAFGRERILYDKYHEVELAIPDLDLKLQSLYRESSDLIVVFVCEDYAKKDWCGLEWRAIRDLMKDSSRPDTDVMFLRLDDKPLQGLLSIDGYIDVQGRTEREIADIVLRRWTATR